MVNQRRNISFRNHALVLLLVTIVMGISGCLIYSLVHSRYYEDMRNQSYRLANSYAQSAKSSLEAYDITTRLLDEQLQTASEVVATYEYHSDELLSRLAKAMSIDEIYAYDENGMIVHTSSGKYLGWTAYEGHPVHDFIHSGETFRIDAIRRDSESHLFYKYAYLRLEKGTIVQLGILAERIRSFSNYFDINSFLTELYQDEFIAGVHYIDSDQHMTTRCFHSIEENERLLDYVMKQIQAGTNATGITDIGGKKQYQTTIPIQTKNKVSGYLILYHDLEQLDTTIGIVTGAGFFALLIIYLLITFFYLNSYNNSKTLERLAYHDSLTDLPNKRYFEDDINFDRKNPTSARRAVVLIHYNNYSRLNAVYSYHYGERFIRELADQLSKSCTEERRLYHISSAQFAFYIKTYSGTSSLIDFCDTLVNTISHMDPLKPSGISVGVVEIKSRMDYADILLKQSSIAANFAENAESLGYCFYDQQIAEIVRREDTIEHALHKVVSDSEQSSNLYLVYQPIMNLKTNAVCGFEALARLNCDELGIIPPHEFISIAERTQQIGDLGNLILRKACRFIQIMQENAKNLGHVVTTSVNISASQLLMDDYIPDLLDILNETGADPAFLTLELTESVFSNHFDLINQKLKTIQDMGIRVCIDDFGTGYSALSRERDLNINCLKMDKTFIDKLITMRPEDTITSDIITMAHKLGHMVVAEGVEYEEQKSYLAKEGCDCIQGFFYSCPLSFEDALSFLGLDSKMYRDVL